MLVSVNPLGLKAYKIRTVVVDAGHGGHDPGAISPHSGKREKDITLALVRAVRAELTQLLGRVAARPEVAA